MIKKIFPVLAILMILILPACAPQAAMPEVSVESSRDMSGEFMPESPASDFAGNVQGQLLPSAPPAQVDRLVIKNGSISILVDDPVRSMDNVTRLAEEMGGFVVSANLSEIFLESGDRAPQASIMIRVPAERFNEALEKIKAESGQTPQYENISSQDVTSEYTDLESRLRNLEAAEQQLSEIMGSAVRTEDVLSVYTQLVQVREQIEVIKGQMKYFEQSAAMSSISIELVANAAVQPLTIGNWQPEGTARTAVQALINALKGLGNLVIWIILFLLPVLVVLYIIFVLPLSLVWRAWRRRRAKNKMQNLPPAPPAQAG